MLLISENKGDSAKFSDFARAEKLEYQLKYTEAAELYKSIAINGNAAGLEAGVRSAKLYSKVNELEESRVLLEKMIGLYGDSENLDEVYFILAGVYDTMENPEYALELYRNILISYPNSFFLEEARDRARTLSARILKDENP
jgi:tetratricopeptide (TPR) repeat protein